MENINNVNFHEATYLDKNGILQTINVPVVQDLSRSKNLPHNFIRDVTPAQGIPASSFPAIDMAKLHPGTDQDEELEKLASIAKEWGMFLIKNHEIEQALMNDVKDVVKGFFNLSFKEKKASVGSYRSVDNMGYGRNFVKSGDQPLDWIDRLTMKAAPKDATEGLKVWPRYPSNFRQVFEKYVHVARQIMDKLLHALANALSLDIDAFSQYFNPEKSEINVRVNYYPPCPRPDSILGVIPHTDASALTLLMEFHSSGGLQVFKDNKWYIVPWPSVTLLVNVGDFLEIMSNGRLKSPWHRTGTQWKLNGFQWVCFITHLFRLRSGPLKMESDPLKKEGQEMKSTRMLLLGNICSTSIALIQLLLKKL